MVKVKICGNKSIEDARMCINAGVDVVGVLVGQKHLSNDFVDKYVAKEISEFVNRRCKLSMVTHLTDASEIIELSRFIGNDIIQLHSNIPESEVLKISKALPNIELVRLVHVSKEGKICTNLNGIKYVDYYLLDSFNSTTDQVGGTGVPHNWNKSREIIQSLNKPAFLAGGLTPNNVKIAIQTVCPYGVDVNTGCKNAYGAKDANKILEFVKNSKNAI